MISESDLDLWREDPLLNEHHEHWHLVYPYRGSPGKRLRDPHQLGPKRGYQARSWKDRHGELFAYMHSQLLARYGAERLSVGLLPVEPFDDYGASLGVGYSPSPEAVWRTSAGEPRKIGGRPDNEKLRDLTVTKFVNRPGAKLEDQARFLARLQLAAETGKFATTSARSDVDLNVLAERVEPTDRFASPYYGALHNDGHLHFALFDDGGSPPGPMFHETMAVRDPIFYRWHKHIDNLFRAWEDTQPPHQFSDLPEAEVVELNVTDERTGYANVLGTEVRRRILRRIWASRQGEVEIPYLSHNDFTYDLKVVNRRDGPIVVTVRIFLVPADLEEDRRAWIEMDKFFTELQAGAATIKRHSSDSSVIRHPVLTARALEGDAPLPDERGSSLGCRCGWPYTLLVPRGNKGTGMRCRVLAMLSPGEDLAEGDIGGAFGWSYCGVEDANYPDKRAMGYPFDRPFAGSLVETIKRIQTVKLIELQIVQA